MAVPKLDDEIKEQIKKVGKNPHFGAERSLFKLQEQILEMAGPLTCLWADILSQKAVVKQKDILLLLQRVLVQLGGVSHSITQERRRIAWGRINPANTLPDEPEEEKEVTLFGGGFLERATKRIEKAKELQKVKGSSRRSGAPPQKCKYQDRDPNDLHHFFGERCPVKVRQREPSTPKAIPPSTSQAIPTACKEVPEDRSQEDKQPVTERQTSHAHMILINNFLSPIPCVSHLPMASRLPHCIGNWRHITTNPWVLQVVMGYRLEPVSPPV